jgi:hypothetical protein
MRSRSFAILGIITASAGCGGGAQLITGPDLLTYSATSQVTSNNPMRFSTTVTVTNGTTEAISFTTDCGNPRTVVYATAARTGTPTWDSNTREIHCALGSVNAPVTLGPGKSVTYTLTATGAEVLGASGTAGTYYLLDEVRLDGVGIPVAAGQLNLAR